MCFGEHKWQSRHRIGAQTPPDKEPMGPGPMGQIKRPGAMGRTKGLGHDAGPMGRTMGRGPGPAHGPDLGRPLDRPWGPGKKKKGRTKFGRFNETCHVLTALLRFGQNKGPGAFPPSRLDSHRNFEPF